MLFVGRLVGDRAESPNVDSLLWFITAVMPVLDGLLGADYRLHVAGLLEALNSDRVILHGIVEDLTPLYDRCRLFVAPTRYAAGIPLKVIEAMSQGVPCVATPLLADQLQVTARELPTGGTADDFARACARLYADEEAWRGVSAAGLDHVRAAYSRAAFDRALMDAIAPA